MITLLIDIGNTRIKWAHYSPQISADKELVGHGVLEHDSQIEAETLQYIIPPANLDFILVSAVTDDLNSQRIKKQLQTIFAVPVQMVKSAPQFNHLVNGYKQPALLGVDRWVALIGAFAQAKPGRGVLVVDAGTAITIDAVDVDGKHLGGIISPGLSLMRNSLSQNTERLMLVEEAEICTVADNTQDAIASGTIWSLVGLIQQIEQRLALDDGKIDYLITGGDAQKLLPHLPVRYILVTDLILQGLAALAQNSNKE